MKAREIEPIDPGNPFLSDYFNMGSILGTNVVVMYRNFPKDKAKYLIIVDTTTGERLQIDFPEESDG